MNRQPFWTIFTEPIALALLGTMIVVIAIIAWACARVYLRRRRARPVLVVVVATLGALASPKP